MATCMASAMDDIARKTCVDTNAKEAMANGIGKAMSEITVLTCGPCDP